MDTEIQRLKDVSKVISKIRKGVSVYKIKIFPIPEVGKRHKEPDT